MEPSGCFELQLTKSLPLTMLLEADKNRSPVRSGINTLSPFGLPRTDWLINMLLLLILYQIRFIDILILNINIQIQILNCPNSSPMYLHRTLIFFICWTLSKHIFVSKNMLLVASVYSILRALKTNVKQMQVDTPCVFFYRPVLLLL